MLNHPLKREYFDLSLRSLKYIRFLVFHRGGVQTAQLIADYVRQLQDQDLPRHCILTQAHAHSNWNVYSCTT